jgi:hypothetical protein
MTEKTLKKLASGLMAFALCICQVGCAAKAADKTEKAEAEVVIKGNFSADSAYNYVARQVSFGPRVPGTDAHRACAEWLSATLRSNGADTVIEQRTVVEAYTGDKLPICNILARYNVNVSRRILLVAHWDCRPWADNSPNEADHSKAIDGANDGASGVGVLLEIARNMGEQRPDVGVDILLTDAEDYGFSGGGEDTADTWCLGTQYWCDHMPYGAADKPVYGILLDMVGGVDAKFHREYFSDRYAQSVNSKIWAEAASLGLGNIFIDQQGGAITDDHVYLLAAGIPTVDIIEAGNPATGSFSPTWHTLDDKMDNIDRKTLSAVGRTVTNIIYKEKSH